jgi:hypothetical protein
VTYGPWYGFFAALFTARKNCRYVHGMHFVTLCSRNGFCDVGTVHGTDFVTLCSRYGFCDVRLKERTFRRFVHGTDFLTHGSRKGFSDAAFTEMIVWHALLIHRTDFETRYAWKKCRQADRLTDIETDG